MEVYQITATCAQCKLENKVIIADETATVACESCGTQLIKAKRFAGVIYVMSNPKVEGVKIGMTSKNVFARAKQISGTGVPGSFSVVAAFPSNNPHRDERRIHEKLTRKRIGKEHFQLDPVSAVVRIRTILGRDWVYIDRKHERDVIVKQTEQRASALSKFKRGKPVEPPADLFPDLDQNTFETTQSSEAVDRRTRKPGGFLANLFQ